MLPPKEVIQIGLDECPSRRGHHPVAMIVSVNLFEQLGHCHELTSYIGLAHPLKAVYARVFP
jgi:hypothetical protein